MTWNRDCHTVHWHWPCSGCCPHAVPPQGGGADGGQEYLGRREREGEGGIGREEDDGYVYDVEVLWPSLHYGCRQPSGRDGSLSPPIPSWVGSRRRERGKGKGKGKGLVRRECIRKSGRRASEEETEGEREKKEEGENTGERVGCKSYTSC